MQMFYCVRCGHETDRKYSLKLHLNKKRKCDSIISNIDTEKCLELSQDKDFLVKLLKKKLLSNTKELDEKKEEIKELKTIINGNNNLIGVGNNNVIDNRNIKIDIHINGYKNTDYNLLQDGARNCIKNNGSFDFGKFLTLLHFDENIPQNHNICVVNKKEKTINVYDGKHKKFIEYTKGEKGLEKILKEKLDFIESNEDMFDMTAVEASCILKDDYFKYENFDEEQKKTFLYEDVYLPLCNGSTIILSEKNK